MKKIIPFVILLVAGIFSGGCRKNGDIDGKPPAREYNLVVEGGINTFQTLQYIRLSVPVFRAGAIPQPALGATVVVNDGQKDINFRETSTPGVYSGVVVKNTNYNKAYTLKVTYNNKHYTAVDTLRQVVSIIDDFLPLSCVKQAGGSIKITLPKHTFGFLNSCKWLIAYSGIPLWNPAKFDAARFYSYTHSQGSPNSAYPLLNQSRTAELQPGDIISIYKFSLSEDYSRYLYSVFQETDWKGILSGVPGEIKGNLSEGALGFFYVVDVDFRRYQVSELVN
jgi:hypothetical protein